MKTILIAIFILIGLTSAFASERFDADGRLVKTPPPFSLLSC